MPHLILLLLSTPAALNHLGASAFARGQYAAAQQLFVMAWRQQPSASLASNLGAAARHLREWDAAERWFTRVIELRTAALGSSHADTAIAWNNRGETRMQAGRPAEARTDLAWALELTPLAADRAAILHNLGELERQQGRLAQARQQLEASLALRPDSTATMAVLARVLAEMAEGALERARLREAIRLCRQALALAPIEEPALRCQQRVEATVVDVR